MADDNKNSPTLDRGANDDWEALKLLLDDHPSLKQRVIHKMRELMKKSDDGEAVSFSLKETRELLLKEQARKKGG